MQIFGTPSVYFFSNILAQEKNVHSYTVTNRLPPLLGKKEKALAGEFCKLHVAEVLAPLATALVVEVLSRLSSLQTLERLQNLLLVWWCYFATTTNKRLSKLSCEAFKSWGGENLSKMFTLMKSRKNFITCLIWGAKMGRLVWGVECELLNFK